MVNSNPSFYRREALGGRPPRTAFVFESLKDYNKFIEDTGRVATGNARRGLDIINAPNYIRGQLSMRWYGTTDLTLATEQPTSYLFNNELEAYLQTARSRTVNVDLVDIDQVKTIKFTEQEVGIFSFDLASLGLIPVYEFYSPLLKKVVSGNLIRAYKNSENNNVLDANGKPTFYHIKVDAVKKHDVKFDASLGGYYSEILMVVIDKAELFEEDRGGVVNWVYLNRDEIPEHSVERVHKLDENGRKRFATTWKKSFIYIPKVDKPLPRIDIIVVSSFHGGVNAQNQMIYNSMTAIALAEKLSKARVDYRMLVAYTNGTSNNAQEVYSYVTLKKEGEALDKNKMAVLLSDGRMMRLQGFRGDLAMQYDAGYDTTINSGGIGKPITDITKVKNAYIDFLKLQKNASDISASKREDTKIVLGGSLSLRETEDQYNRVIGQISKLITP